MDLAVLLPRSVAQVHAPITTQRLEKENGDGRHYTTIRPADIDQLLDLTHTAQAKKSKTTPVLRKLG
jgi:hypothetical protein